MLTKSVRKSRRLPLNRANAELARGNRLSLSQVEYAKRLSNQLQKYYKLKIGDACKIRTYISRVRPRALHLKLRRQTTKNPAVWGGAFWVINMVARHPHTPIKDAPVSSTHACVSINYTETRESFRLSEVSPLPR